MPQYGVDTRVGFDQGLTHFKSCIELLFRVDVPPTRVVLVFVRKPQTDIFKIGFTDSSRVPVVLLLDQGAWVVELNPEAMSVETRKASPMRNACMPGNSVKRD